MAVTSNCVNEKEFFFNWNPEKRHEPIQFLAWSSEKKDLKKTDNELNTIYDANIKQSPVKSRVCCILELK